MWITFCICLLLFVTKVTNEVNQNRHRNKRYLIFTPSTQYGVFATVSLPIHPDSYTSVAWFFEANYYNVDNASYFEPLLGDITVTTRDKSERSVEEQEQQGFLTRISFYKIIEALLERNGFPRSCLLRAICENTSSHFLHNGVLGDFLHLILTPSASMEEEDLEDEYYEAEFLGTESDCDHYHTDCDKNPLDLITVKAENFLQSYKDL